MGAYRGIWFLGFLSMSIWKKFIASEILLSTIQLISLQLWGENAVDKVFKNDGIEIRNQQDLNKLFTKDNQARLPSK